MHLDFYSTPLWFGFIQAWIYAILLWYRSATNNRLSDLFLGIILVGLGFEIWEYMLGFSGINILWEQFNFLPRGIGMALPALCYFYLKTQFDTSYRLSRKDLIHFLPITIYFIYRIIIFSFGKSFVDQWYKNVHEGFGINYVETILLLALQIYYLNQSNKLYQKYKAWILTQFSDVESISFKWFRNFMIVLVIGIAVRWIKIFVGMAFELDFYQDWWDNLVMVILIYYICINGYGQIQPTRGLAFNDEKALELKPETNLIKEKYNIDEAETWKNKIKDLMQNDKLYLQPDLTLSDIALRLKTNTSVLSAIVNQTFGKNFNDFVNEFRVNEFQEKIKLPENKNITLLGLAYDSGFNSKATFNRAIKKFTGKSPKEFL